MNKKPLFKVARDEDQLILKLACSPPMQEVDGQRVVDLHAIESIARSLRYFEQALADRPYVFSQFGRFEGGMLQLSVAPRVIKEQKDFLAANERHTNLESDIALCVGLLNSPETCISDALTAGVTKKRLNDLLSEALSLVKVDSGTKLTAEVEFLDEKSRYTAIIATSEDMRRSRTLLKPPQIMTLVKGQFVFTHRDFDNVHWTEDGHGFLPPGGRQYPLDTLVEFVYEQEKTPRSRDVHRISMESITDDDADSEGDE